MSPNLRVNQTNAELDSLGRLVTVTANPGAKVSKCTEEVNLTKVRAERFHEIKLGVSALPEHEIAEALLSGGSNDQVRVRLTLGIEVTGYGLDTDGVREVIKRSP